jgi:hypothetical protein
METAARPWSARRFWDGDSAYQQHAVVSMNTHLHVKRTYGVVPVAPDGSAHFRVPAKKNFFFQALDGDFMEVQRMCTFVNFQPGETRSCIGCHQQRQWAPQAKRLAALEHPADAPAPQPGDSGPRPIYHATNVQLSREEFIRLVTWVDANAPYFGSYYGRRNLKYKTHPDFRPIPTMDMSLR